ncbi:hypothetical protein ABIB82_004072 [Bradyrhizobium sp. i1.8.4]|uniref:hypothetical protein n=1 Tax=unclassified Bradyrhizobium TaxID=2631580 RepID=UPI003D1F3624
MNVITSTAVFAGASAVAPTLASNIAGDADPIFAAIEHHKAARAEFARWADLQGELEIANVRSTDPRWIEADEEVTRSMKADDAAAIELLNIRPTTMAGLLALLKHATEFDTDGQGFPEDLHSNDERDISRSWQFFLIENVAGVLAERLAA